MPIKIHHPLLPMSCSLLTLTLIDGSNSASKAIKPTYPISSVIIVPRVESIANVMILTIKLNKMNHQYSERDALPSKFT